MKNLPLSHERVYPDLDQGAVELYEAQIDRSATQQRLREATAALTACVLAHGLTRYERADGMVVELGEPHQTIKVKTPKKPAISEPEKR